MNEKRYDYVLLHGCKKNVGDFLIFDRGKKLLKRYLKNSNFLELKGWDKLDGNLSNINNSKGLIIIGGPGLQEKMYPNTYPLVNNLNLLSVPIYTLGSGWKGFPGDLMNIYSYRFTNNSKKFLKKISKIGVRDIFTLRALKNNGFNAFMNGCPVWYDLDFIGKPLKVPEKIKRIVFTPSESAKFHAQSIKIMALIKKMFPKAEVICSFHRGIKRDKHTSARYEKNVKRLINEANKLNFKIVDTSYDIRNLDFYGSCDLHIGYRLHAHILFLSKRMPSFLLNEDGRGRGLSESLGIPSINAWGKIIPLDLSFLRLIHLKYLFIKENKFAVKQLEEMINEQIDSDFSLFIGLDKKIDYFFNRMKIFIESIN